MIFFLYLSIPIGIDPVETNEALVRNDPGLYRFPPLQIQIGSTPPTLRNRSTTGLSETDGST
jgi:hypothetical protein